MGNDNKHSRHEQVTSTYQTGSTHPPKSHGGIIAVLLIAVIFLSGINGVLSMMNIRLFQKLQDSKAAAHAGVDFSPAAATSAVEENARTCTTLPFGFRGCPLTSFEQILYQLPQGFYVTEVTPKGLAEQLGICPGDILVQLGDQQLESHEKLTALLEKLHTGDRVQAIFYRSGREVTLELIVG